MSSTRKFQRQNTKQSTMTIDQQGNKCWLNRAGKLHRTDGPAVERANGNKVWWVNGKLHRTDGPAVERTDGSTEWHLNDKFLGPDAAGFWAFWDRLSNQQRTDLNIQLWAAKYC